MAAGKDETQAVILDFLILVRRLPHARFAYARLEIECEIFLRAVEACPPAHSVYSFEACGGNEPGPRFTRYAGLRPRVQSSGKGLVHRLLGNIKITEQTDQSCQDSSRIHAIKGVEQFAYLLGGTLGHDEDLSKPSYPESIWQTADRCKVLRSSR